MKLLAVWLSWVSYYDMFIHSSVPRNILFVNEKLIKLYCNVLHILKVKIRLLAIPLLILVFADPATSSSNFMIIGNDRKLFTMGHILINTTLMAK